MLTQEENKMLTQTGPETPMGQLFRRYWMPVSLSDEVGEPGGDPVRVTLLGEELVIFRSPSGEVGLVSEFCQHRRASLFFGRNEEGGIRCPYHGWKYDLNGHCIDMPSEPPGTAFMNKIRHPAYTCAERGGVIWAYMGPAGKAPPLPEFDWLEVGPHQRFVTKSIRRCNYFQVLEGGLDSSHVGLLHSDTRYWNRVFKASEQEVKILSVLDASPEYSIEPAPWGLMLAAGRDGETPDHRYWRLTPWIAPSYMIVPPFMTDAPYRMDGAIPIDDEHCWFWAFSWHPHREITDYERYLFENGVEGHVPRRPGTSMPLPRMENDYLIDRDLIRFGAYTGLKGVQVQDMAMQESQGPVFDRTKEHLGVSDTAIIEVRRALLKMAQEQAHQEDLPGLAPESHHVHSVTTIASKATALDTLRETMTASIPIYQHE